MTISTITMMIIARGRLPSFHIHIHVHIHDHIHHNHDDNNQGRLPSFHIHIHGHIHHIHNHDDSSQGQPQPPSFHIRIRGHIHHIHNHDDNNRGQPPSCISISMAISVRVAMMIITWFSISFSNSSGFSFPLSITIAMAITMRVTMVVISWLSISLSYSSWLGFSLAIAIAMTITTISIAMMVISWLSYSSSEEGKGNSNQKIHLLVGLNSSETQGNVDGDTTLTLCLQLVQHPGIFEGALAHLGGFLLELLNGSLVNASALVDQVTSGGGFARVDMANDHDVNVKLFLSHCCLVSVLLFHTATAAAPSQVTERATRRSSGR